MALRYLFSRRLPLVNAITTGSSSVSSLRAHLPGKSLSTWNNRNNLLCFWPHNHHQQFFFSTTTTTSTTTSSGDILVQQQPFLNATRSTEPVIEDDEPFPSSGSATSNINKKSIEEMTNEELMDTSTIPGFHLIHSPPRKFPRGALVGTVVSDKMQKTINVAVNRYRIHPKYRKRLKYTRKFMAHDESEVARIGDVVMITPCHKITKNKHFMLREIIRPKGTIY